MKDVDYLTEDEAKEELEVTTRVMEDLDDEDYVGSSGDGKNEEVRRVVLTRSDAQKAPKFLHRKKRNLMETVNKVLDGTPTNFDAIEWPSECECHYSVLPVEKVLN